MIGSAERIGAGGKFMCGTWAYTRIRTVGRRLLLTAAATVVVALSVTGCNISSSEDATTPATATVLSGTVGAARYTDGYAVIGSGPVQVDLYVDPMCPYCRMFEQTNSARLTADAEAGKITVRVHPVAILDRLSQGSRYSSRAAASIIDVAAHHPDKLAPYLTALYKHQPEENTAGLTDTDLARIAGSIGAPFDKDMLVREQTWVGVHTQQALTGPLPGTREVPALTSVPAVFVDGHHYPGSSDDHAAFSRFYNQQLR